MGNAAAGGLEQEPAENSVGAASGMSDPTPTLQKKQPAPPKLPMPPEEELEERFNVVLVSGRKGDKKAVFTFLVCIYNVSYAFVVEAWKVWDNYAGMYDLGA